MGAERAVDEALFQQWPPLFARGLAVICASVILATLALDAGPALQIVAP
ncbi:hypothetical protein [Bradyrhizobium sp. LB11.1]|jgi:hypothetical protein